MATLQQADKLAASGNLEGARALYLAAAGEGTPGASERLCQITAILGRGEEALACAERALSLLPKSHFLHALAGQEALGLGHARQAASSYARARGLGPRDADYALNMGIAMRAAGLFSEASAALHGALALAPRSAAAYSELAGALEALGDASSASKHRARASRLVPDSAKLALDWGNALLQAQRPAEAAQAMERTIRLASPMGREQMPALASVAYFGLGRASFALGDACAALDAFEGAAALSPVPDAETWHQRGVAVRRCRLDGVAEARHAWRRAISLAPHRSNSLSLLHLTPRVRPRQRRPPPSSSSPAPLSPSSPPAQPAPSSPARSSTPWIVEARGATSPTDAVAGAVEALPETASTEATLADTAEEKVALAASVAELSVESGDGAEWLAHALSLLQRNGALLVTGLLPPSVTSPLARHLRQLSRDNAPAQRSKGAAATLTAAGSKRLAYSTINTTFMPNRRRHHAVSLRVPAVAAALATAAPSLHPLLCAALTCEHSLRLVESASIIAMPGARAQPLHTDTAQARTLWQQGIESPCYKVQLSADIVDAAMGPIEVVPGSVRDPPLATRSTTPLPLPLPAGAALVYNTQLWHRGGAHTAHKPRDAVFYVSVLTDRVGAQPPAGLPYTIEPDEAACYTLTHQGAEVVQTNRSSKQNRRCAT